MTIQPTSHRELFADLDLDEAFRTTPLFADTAAWLAARENADTTTDFDSAVDDALALAAPEPSDGWLSEQITAGKLWAAALASGSLAAALLLVWWVSL